MDSELHWHSLEGYFLKSLIPTGRQHIRDVLFRLAFPIRTTCSKANMACKESTLNLRVPRPLSSYGQPTFIKTSRTSVRLLSTLAYLHKKGRPRAIAFSSHRSWIELVLDKFDLHSAFQVVVSADEVGGKGKPAPDIYLYTAGKLQVRPEILDGERGQSQRGAIC